MCKKEERREESMPPFIPQPRLIGRLPPLLSIPTSPPFPSSSSTLSSSWFSSFLSSSVYFSFHSSSFLFPSDPTTSGAILQFNCNGILHCMQELTSFLHWKNILLSCVQKCKLKSTKVLQTNSSPNFTADRKDCPGDTGDRRLTTLIHHSITFISISSDSLFDESITEYLSITATISNISVNIHSIYIPLYAAVPPISHQSFTFFLTTVITTSWWETSMLIALPGTLILHIHLQRHGVL